MTVDEIRWVRVPDSTPPSYEGKLPGPALNCPFCGGSRLVITRTDRFDLVAHPEWVNDQDAYAYVTHCTSCACDGPWKKSATLALADWNRRPPLPRVEVKLNNP